MIICFILLPSPSSTVKSWKMYGWLKLQAHLHQRETKFKNKGIKIHTYVPPHTYTVCTINRAFNTIGTFNIERTTRVKILIYFCMVDYYKVRLRQLVRVKAEETTKMEWWGKGKIISLAWLGSFILAYCMHADY